MSVPGIRTLFIQQYLKNLKERADAREKERYEARRILDLDDKDREALGLKPRVNRTEGQRTQRGRAAQSNQNSENGEEKTLPNS